MHTLPLSALTGPLPHTQEQLRIQPNITNCCLLGAAPVWCVGYPGPCFMLSALPRLLLSMRQHTRQVMLQATLPVKLITPCICARGCVDGGRSGVQ
jgi:hypothetical protein